MNDREQGEEGREATEDAAAAPDPPAAEVTKRNWRLRKRREDEPVVAGPADPGQQFEEAAASERAEIGEAAPAEESERVLAEESAATGEAAPAVGPIDEAARLEEPELPRGPGLDVEAQREIEGQLDEIEAEQQNDRAREAAQAKVETVRAGLTQRPEIEALLAFTGGLLLARVLKRLGDG